MDYGFGRRFLHGLSLACLLLLLNGGCVMLDVPGRSHRGAPPATTPAQTDLAARLHKHVDMLAGVIGERNLWKHEMLEASAQYIEKALGDLGYEPAGQVYQVHDLPVRNIEAILTGTARPEEIVVVGAHYDSVMGCPGANDNASGVAAVLELARLLRDRRFARTVRFVAFANEEPPFYHTPDMGSWVYARRCRQRNEKIVAMLTPETIGYYSDAAGSQHYPAPLGMFYPSTGNFIAFVGNWSSRSLVRQTAGTFRQHAAFPSEGGAAPETIAGIGASDHWSFWQEGYPGVMVTDTAPFRYPYYHTAQDTPDKIDYERTARVVEGLAQVVAELADGSQH